MKKCANILFLLLPIAVFAAWSGSNDANVESWWMNAYAGFSIPADKSTFSGYTSIDADDLDSGLLTSWLYMTDGHVYNVYEPCYNVQSLGIEVDAGTDADSCSAETDFGQDGSYAETQGWNL